MINGTSKTTTRSLTQTEISNLLKKKITEAINLITPSSKVAAFAIFVVNKDGAVKGSVHSDIDSMQDLIGMMDRYITETKKAVEYDKQ